MAAIDDLIANIRRTRFAEGDGPIIADSDTLIAALQQIAGATGGGANPSNGRLTLTSGAPVLSADVVAASTLFWSPYNGNKTAVFNGTSFSGAESAELNLSIAALAADTVFDIFGASDGAGGLQLLSQAWASSSARAIGVSRVAGIPINDAAIGAVAAQRATLLGTIATDAASRCSMMFAPAAAVGGAGNRLDVWNMWNRVAVSSVNRDSTATWGYSTGTWRARNNSPANGIIFVCGLAGDHFLANADMGAENSTAGGAVIGFGFDSTTVLHASSPAVWCATQVAGKFGSAAAAFSLFPGIGRHTVTPLEEGNGSATTTWRNNTVGGAGDIRGSMRLLFPM